MAAGNKLQKIVRDLNPDKDPDRFGDHTQDYVGGIEYKDGKLEAIYHAQGRAVKVGGSWIYEYYLKDHLGNVRVAIDQNGTLLQKNNYYPFGLEHNNYTAIQQELDPKNKYKYNGKELLNDLGFDWYAYGFRYYDAQIGRFTGVDPIADQFAHLSVFNYADNSPVAHIDLHGLQKVYYDKKAAKNETFSSARAINLQTSGGLEFLEVLKSQNKIDVVYAISPPRGADGATHGPFKSFDDLKSKLKKKDSYNLNNAIKENWREYEHFFEEGKEIMIITTNCFENTCSDSEIRDGTQTLNHEEVSHGINRLKGKKETTQQEHTNYNGVRSIFSPTLKQIKTDLKYENSKAKKQLDEIDSIMGNN